jgi:predicted enzyme related to lactoylglutathione lyase
MHGDIIAFGIPVLDTARARRFYEALGLVALDETTLRGADGVAFRLRPGHQPTTAGPLIIIPVASLDDARRRGEAAGGKRLGKPRDGLLELLDTEGNRVGVVESGAARQRAAMLDELADILDRDAWHRARLLPDADLVRFYEDHRLPPHRDRP